MSQTLQIMKMGEQIADLEKEKEEQREQLAKAKEIIEAYVLTAKVEHLKGRYESVDEAEAFLKELEISEDRLCEHCDQYKSFPDGKRCRSCDNGSKWKRGK